MNVVGCENDFIQGLLRADGLFSYPWMMYHHTILTDAAFTYQSKVTDDK
jgi:hypothetical protein